MAVPSVMKIKKGEVVFEQSVDRANYLITELTRRAMQDVGRYVLYQVSKSLRADPGYGALMRKTPLRIKRYQMWVRKKEQDLILGIENTRNGAESAFWADQAELGTNGQPKRGYLYTAVYDNIDKIREIEAQYLSAIEDDMQAEAMVDEEEVLEEAE